MLYDELRILRKNSSHKQERCYACFRVFSKKNSQALKLLFSHLIFDSKRGTFQNFSVALTERVDAVGFA